MRIRVLGVGFDNLTMDEAVERGLAMLEENKSHYVVTPNPEIVEVCREWSEVSQAVNGADMVLPDGSGIIKGAAMLNTPLKERTPGIEFAQNLMAELAKTDYSLFLLGGKPGIAEKAAARLRERYPGLKIAGVHDGYFQEDAPVIMRIWESGADVVFVCMGAPRQELWMRNHGQETGARLLCGLGGSLDIFAGVSKRAPKFWCDHGLEWLYRLLKEPYRWRRMMKLPLFLSHVRRERRIRKRNGILPPPPGKQSRRSERMKRSEFESKSESKQPEHTEIFEPIENIARIEDIESAENITRIEDIEPVENTARIEDIESAENTARIEDIEPVEDIARIEDIERIAETEKTEETGQIEEIEQIEPVAEEIKSEPAEQEEIMSDYSRDMNYNADSERNRDGRENNAYNNNDNQESGRNWSDRNQWDERLENENDKNNASGGNGERAMKRDAEETRRETRSDRKKRRKKRWWIRIPVYLLTVALVSFLMAEGGWLLFADLCAFDRGEQMTATVVVAPGDDMRDVAEKLRGAGLIKYELFFLLFARFAKAEEKIGEGIYELNTDMDYRALIVGMRGSSGSIGANTVRVTIPEGLALRDIVALLAKNGVATEDELMEAARTADFDFDFIDNNSEDPSRLEGYLFPDTYDFYQPERPASALNRLLSNFARKRENWLDGLESAANRGYDLKAIVTIASLIEKETDGVDQARIASVIDNRLNGPGDRGGTYGLLQIDASLLYVLDHKAPITTGDLELDSPYNLYKYAGLPPTPIGNPGAKAIEAALAPEVTDYYYYGLAKDNRHQFFTNYRDFTNFLSSSNFIGN